MRICNMFIICTLIATLWACNNRQSPQQQADEDTTVAPVNPDASPEAVSLLRFLYDIQGKYILSGQHNFISSGSKYHDIVLEMTGKSPVVWGCDFSFNVVGDNAHRYHHCGPLNLVDPADSAGFEHNIPPDSLRARMTDEAIRMWRKGHIITLMWHHCFPTEGDSCLGSSVWAMENRPSPAQFDSLVTPGTKLHAAWKAQLDLILPWLKKLRDARVPVLWRPYHEMNGVWFWWCNHQGDTGFRKLWLMMYDYFVNEHKLNNLLWVWDPNAPRDIEGDEAWPYERFYPGNDYVDVLAADVYRKDYQQSHHDQLVKLGGGKPIALGEIGDLPPDSVLTAQTSWTWFMVWGYFINKRFNTPEQVKALYANPRVLTLDEVNRNADSGFSVKPESLR